MIENINHVKRFYQMLTEYLPLPEIWLVSSKRNANQISGSRKFVQNIPNNFNGKLGWLRQKYNNNEKNTHFDKIS